MMSAITNRGLLKPSTVSRIISQRQPSIKQFSSSIRCNQCSSRLRIRQLNRCTLSNGPLQSRISRPNQWQVQKRTLLSEASSTHAPLNPFLREIVRSLNDFLLMPRSLPLPRWMTIQHYSFTFSELFGHGSFILVAASYATDDFLHLRIMAVMGAGSMLFFTYFHPHGRVLWLPLKWNALFIAINSYRIASVMWNRYQADRMSPELKKFREDHLYIVDPVDYYNLFSIGTEEEFEEGDLVIQQGSANPFIRVVVDGELEVRRDGVLTYIVEEGNFLSEAGLHAGLMLGGTIESCASIVVGKRFHSEKDATKATGKQKVRCVRWNRDELIKLLQDDKPLKNALKAALSWDIVRKLKMQRHMLTDGRVHDPQAWTKKREDQGISRYAAILQNMLRHPDQVKDMSEVLMKYRMIHHIEDADHAKALAKAGWTEKEFREGHREHEDDEEDYVDDEEFEMARWTKAKRYSSRIMRFITVGN